MTQTPIALSPANPTPRSADRSRPITFIHHHPSKLLHTPTGTARAVFRFGSNEAGVTFLCRVDRRPFRVCLRRTVRRFGLGRHVFRVKARDTAGNVDRTPAVFRFQVTRVG